MKNTPDTTKTGNGLVQLIRMEKSISHIWVNVSFHSTETDKRCKEEEDMYRRLWPGWDVDTVPLREPPRGPGTRDRVLREAVNMGRNVECHVENR